MPEKNTTLHVSIEDRAIIKRAKKLLRFHEDRTFSSFITDKCREIVEKYDGKEQGRRGRDD